MRVGGQAVGVHFHPCKPFLVLSPVSLSKHCSNYSAASSGVCPGERACPGQEALGVIAIAALPGKPEYAHVSDEEAKV